MTRGRLATYTRSNSWTDATGRTAWAVRACDGSESFPGDGVSEVVSRRLLTR
jgi:hypothetical protein